MARRPSKPPKAKPPASRRRAASPAAAVGSVPMSPTPEPRLDAASLLATRELFWQDVIRELLSSLAAMSAMRPGEPAPPDTPASTPSPATPTAVLRLPSPRGAAESPAEQPTTEEPEVAAALGFDPSLFDGRLAIVTRGGDRIGIAAVTPILSCGPFERASRSLANVVACSAFEIRSPEGNVFTLPLSEIRAFHTVTPELLERLTASARKRLQRRGGQVQEPFGFAAFTSVARGLRPDTLGPAPEHPME